MQPFPGSERVLAAHHPPQADQLCGPFSAVAALAALLDDPPSVVALAAAAGTRIWPHDVPTWRPAGAPPIRRGWEGLPTAASESESGTDASGLAAGIEAATGGRVVVVPAAGGTPDGLHRLLESLLDGPYVGVLANLRTGPVLPPGVDPSFDVGHFVVVLALSLGLSEPTRQVVLADTYLELGVDGWPPACRPVDVSALHLALEERGLLLLSAPEHRASLTEQVKHAGLSGRLWRV